jgi:hypothetical protein
VSARVRDRRAGLLAAGLAGALLLAVLFAPDEGTTGAVPRLTTHSREPSGARGFHETAARLGWTAVRNERPSLPALPPSTVYAVLAPQMQLTAAETHELLERVRHGAALFAVVNARSPLADSLGVRFRGRYGRVPVDTGARCEETRRRRAAVALRGTVWATAFDLAPPGSPVVQPFLTLEGSTDTLPRVAAAGFGLGAGRVGLVSDPDLLTNAIFRTCRLEAGVAMLQLLRFVSSSGDDSFTRTTVVFDEWRHGYGRQPSITRVATRFLADNPLGRTMGQLSLAGVLLIAAVGSRPAPPAPSGKRMRRSPLEHVRALSLAYSRVSATRTATRLLVRGLRRRLRLTGTASTARSQSDEEFLEQLRLRFPALASEVDNVSRALQRPLDRMGLTAVGRDLATIERTVTRANQ